MPEQAAPAALDSGVNIMVVDDTPANLQVLVGMLKEHGHRVRPVLDGRMALRAAKADVPDLILLDIIMPGMDGYETCRRLKALKETAQIPVVLFTAGQETQLEALAQKAGAARVVKKPFVDQVFKAISELLGPE